MPKPVNHVVIIHGFGVTPEKMWFPWLHAELERRGIGVTAPALPDPFRPDYDKWMKAMAPVAAKWTPRTLVIAHSLGGAFAIRLLQFKAKVRVRAVILVSPLFASTINVKPLVRFFGRTIDWWVVRGRAREFVVLQAKDDPLVPYDHAFRYEEALDAEKHLLAKGGHLTAKKFPFLLKVVERFLA